MGEMFGSVSLSERDRDMEDNGDPGPASSSRTAGLRWQRPEYRPRDAGERERCDRAQAMIDFLERVFSDADRYLKVESEVGVPGVTTYSFLPAGAKEREQARIHWMLEGNLELQEVWTRRAIPNHFKDDADFKKWMGSGIAGVRAEEAQAKTSKKGSKRSAVGYDVDRMRVHKVMYLWEVLRCTRRNPEAWMREKIPLIAATVTDATDYLERVISNWDRPRSHGGATKPPPQASPGSGNMSKEKLNDLIGVRLARGMDVAGCAMPTAGTGGDVDTPWAPKFMGATDETEKAFQKGRSFERMIAGVAPIAISVGGVYDVTNGSKDPFRASWGGISRRNLEWAGIRMDDAEKATFDDAIKGMMTWLAVRPLKYAIPPSQVAERIAASHKSSTEKLRVWAQAEPKIQVIGMADEIVGAYDSKYLKRGGDVIEEIRRYEGGEKGYRVMANAANGQMKEYLDAMSWQIGGPTSILHLLHWSIAEEVIAFPEIQADGGIKDVKEHFTNSRCMWVPTKVDYAGAEKLSQEMSVGTEDLNVPGWIFHGTSLEALWSMMAAGGIDRSHPMVTRRTL